MKPTRTSLIWALLISCATNTANATTPAEERLTKAPMPHEQYDARGEAVPAHYVRLQGYLEGNPPNEVGLARLKQAVEACVSRRRQAGLAVNPPNNWPDYLLSSREDAYFALNRSIRYTTGITYTISPLDCGLIENISSTAVLASRNGGCLIDLVAKTAKGVCDASGHGAAPVEPGGNSTHANDEALKKMASDPRWAAALAGVRKALAASNASTGKTKTVLGVECEILDQPYAPGGGTACLTRKGSFIPTRTANNPGEAGIPLELESRYGFKMKAARVKLDTSVNPAVFAPYQQPGYTITAQRAQK